MNERLAKIRIKAKFHNISLICAHAPTVEKDDAVNKCLAHDIKIALGDFNATRDLDADIFR